MNPEKKVQRGNELSEQELSGVSGGAAVSDFSRLADSCAWAYGCIDCPHRNIYSKRGMCTEVYNELLERFTMDMPAGERCTRRR